MKQRYVSMTTRLRQYLVDELQKTIELLKGILCSMDHPDTDDKTLSDFVNGVKSGFQKLSLLLEDHTIKSDPAICMRIKICLNYFQVIESSMLNRFSNTTRLDSRYAPHPFGSVHAILPDCIYLN